MSALSLTTAGALRVDGSAVTQPVSGTVTANAGTGTFTVAGTVTANAGTGNFTVVQATAANLNATVTGTVTANIGTTNGLALDTSVNGILVSQGSTTSGEKGPLIQGAVTTASPAYTTAQTSPLSLTTAGALRVDGSAVTQPVSGSVIVNKSTTGTITSAAGSTSSFTVLASNANRISASIYNATNKTLYLAMASTASTSSYTVQIAINSFFELSIDYTGIITGISPAGVNGNVLVTEYT
jgi:hypothetical protein